MVDNIIITKIKEGNPAEKKLFTDNAFFLLANGKKILSDPRMAFTPVEIYSGLIYFGNLPCPTLGAYIEWWQSCKYSSVKESDGAISLVWQFGGSPLSGMNTSMTVSPNGIISQTSVRPFCDLWRPFKEIIHKYKQAPQPESILSLDQVIKILHTDIC